MINMINICRGEHVARMDDGAPFKTGVVEKYKEYYYGYEGTVSMLCGVSIVEGELVLSEPYALRGRIFVPLKVIDEEMGLSKYLRAKKPIYTILTNSPLIGVKVRKNFQTNEYIEEGSEHNLLAPTVRGMLNDVEGRVVFKLVDAEPEKIKKSAEALMEKMALCRSREEFLRMRMK